MASPLLQGKLHISGMDSRAAALARQWQLGLETIAFSYAPLLDDSAALPRTREEIHGISSLWLHGPFAMSTFRSGMWSSRCGSGGNSCGTYRPT